ncbi:phage tail assembly chaperone [Pseudomonas chlororaphis]|uniref:phage tail assembly chaperone n=1 Tax=Pseudomonas chlororaphis TaxID=587753 RepID=UPI0013898ACB|nr:phage tail assembly chaperone [Pseudomonas chlororaphis]
MLYSKVNKGFYDREFHGNDIPADAVEITEEHYKNLLNGQDEGKQISADENGYPMLIDPPPPPPEFFAAAERYWRDAQLAETDGVVSRHRDEVEEGRGTTLTSEQYAELQAYRRALRNWPENGEFPLAEHRPVAPPWLSAELQ